MPAREHCHIVRKGEVLVVENNVEKRTMNLQIVTAVIVNEPQFPKPVHEKAQVKEGGAPAKRGLPQARV